MYSFFILWSCTGPAKDSAGPEADVDADGDGFPSWEYSADPDEADCDDSDPDVTPLNERLIQEGGFLYGDERASDSLPQQEIWLDGYCMDVYETTNSLFVGLLEESREEGRPNQDSQGRPLFDFEDNDDDYPERILDLGDQYAIEPGYEEHPVVEIWKWAAELYCESQGKSLPSEAQWEKAARGEDGQTYPWGEQEPDCTLANHWPRNEAGQQGTPCVDDSLPVGSLPGGVSPYGMQDMAGNVSEWVADWYRADYYQEAPTENPQGPDSGWAEDPQHPDGFVAAAARGGSLGTGEGSLRTFHRSPEPEEATSNGMGFRCVRTPSTP
jgi:formylglycine-generating enzyme